MTTSTPEPPLPSAVARLGDRSLFPDLRPRAYLAHAAISPPSAPVRAAVAAALESYAGEGSGAFAVWVAQRRRLKGRLARLIGARAEDIALVPNTTAGLSAVALCFPWRRGDGVVWFEGEFPANVTPWQRAAIEHDLRLERLSLEPLVRSGGPDLGPLEAALRRGGRLVAVSAVQFRTGARMPLDEMAALCHAHGAEIAVDGIQAVGALPVDAACLDYLAAGSHKWLMGPEGAGFLYVHPDRAPRLVPRLAGWLSHEDPVDFLVRGAGRLRYDKPIRKTPDFLEIGTPNTLGYAGLEAAVALLEQLGPAHILAHAAAYLDALEAGLRERGFASLRSPDRARRSTLLAVRPPPGVDPLALARALAERGVVCNTPDGLLRFAPHWPNALDEVPFVLDAIDAAS